MKTTVNANAKINLYLDVVGRRENGYHDIESVMQSVSLHDTVTVEFIHSSNKTITLSCSDASLPRDEKNLAYRAALRLLEKASVQSYNVNIHIEKRIPVAAGLAGGSADAAATLKALNSLFPSPLSTDALCELGASLGADIPFIIKGGTMTARGIGEILEPCPSLANVVILIVRPKESVSTAEAYRKIDENGLASKKSKHSLSDMTTALENGELNEISRAAYNIFEAVIPTSSEVFTLKKTLDENGALLSMMSGSGPSTFGIFKNETDAKIAAEAISAIGYKSEICTPVN